MCRGQVFRHQRQEARTNFHGVKRGKERYKARYGARQGRVQGMVRQELSNLVKAIDKKQVGRGKKRRARLNFIKKIQRFPKVEFIEYIINI